MRRRTAQILILLGAGGGLISVAWWLLFFFQLLGQNVKAASKCFYQTHAECEIVGILEFFVGIPFYKPELLWISMGVFFVGLIVFSFPSD